MKVKRFAILGLGLALALVLGGCGPQITLPEISFCGDTVCVEGEDSTNCPMDCAGSCGDLICQAGEDKENCPSDCPPVCGNGYCEVGETTDLPCVEDCGGELDPGKWASLAIMSSDYNCNKGTRSVRVSVSDINGEATAVSIVGPGTNGSLALSYDPTTGNWGSPRNLPVPSDAEAPVKYLLNVEDAEGSHLFYASVIQFYTNCPVCGEVTGGAGDAVSFQWSSVSEDSDFEYYDLIVIGPEFVGDTTSANSLTKTLDAGTYSWGIYTIFEAGRNWVFCGNLTVE